MRLVAPVPLEADSQPFGNGNVRPHRIRFDPTDPAFLSRSSEGHLMFRVLAPAEAVEAMITVRVGEDVSGYPLDRVGGAGATSLWEGRIDPPADRIAYSLAFRFEGGVAAYFAPTGVASAIERIDRFELDVADVPHHDVPAWAAGAVVYQIFPERFAVSGGTPAGGPLAPWEASPTSTSFLGGDLPGITEQVGHLVDLGVDVVYLNPIFTSPSNHRYDAVDYLSVDASLGGDDALCELVEELHRNDIRVILDVSLNHCHPRFFAFADVVAKGEASPYAGWFEVLEWPLRVLARPHLIEPDSYWAMHLSRLEAESGVPVERAADDDGPAIEPTYDAWYGVPLMPRIDLQHPEARRYMLDVATYWVREFDVDGWRMDVVRYIDHDFWADLRREVRAVKPDAYLLAEVMGDSRRWLRGDEFDAVMNYTFRELALDYFATATIDTRAFLEGLLEMTAMYSPAVTSVNQNLLGSHDTPRFLTLAGGDAGALLLATLVQLTLPGAPGLYYGDELAMEGEGDPDNRRGMTWDRVDNDHHRAVRELIALRRAHPALRHGEWSVLSVVGDAFAYQRVVEGGERVVVVVNGGTDPVLLPVLDVTGSLWSVGTVTHTADGVRLGGRSGAVLV